MPVPSVTSTPTTSAAQQSGAVAKAVSNTMDKDAFLKLLVAQLKYQSPDSPVDTNQFMAQTAQMTMVETLQEMQKAQEAQKITDQSLLGSSMIGKKVTATSLFGGADIVGTVTGVKLGTDGPVLKLGNTEVALSAVKEVSAS